MNNLEELYKERDTFTKYNQEVPPELAASIAQTEKEMLKEELLPIIENSAMKTLPNYVTTAKILVALEYDDHFLTRIAISRDADTINSFEVVKELTSQNVNAVIEPVNISENVMPKKRRTASIDFSVRFPDGKVISENTALRTMIETFRYIGLDRVSQFNERIKGFPIVGKDKRNTKPGQIWQHYVDGWWVYTNLSNERKIQCIRGVGTMLNIPLEIILNDPDNNVVMDKPAKKKGKRVMFSLNGGLPMCKNRSVLNTVKQFLSLMSNATFKEVRDFFPDKLQGSYGVVKSLKEIEYRKSYNKTEELRWFLEPNEILTAADGVRFAVCNEWGDNFSDFQKHVKQHLEWSLEEVN